MSNTKISIIVIYKNDENTIKSCIESIFNQTYRDFELICVNNGSTDKSEEIVQSFKEGRENLYMLKLPSEHSLNEAEGSAMSIAKGEFICFLTPDKVIYEEFPGGIKPELFNPVFSNIDIENGKIYRREFLENTNIIDQLLDLKIQERYKQLSGIVEKSEKIISDKIDKCEKNNIDNLNFNMVEMKCRLNNVYDYIHAELNMKGGEINNVYAEVDKSFKYTESCKEEVKKDLYQSLFDETQAIKNHISEIENDVVINNKEIKKLLYNQTNEIEEKINNIQVPETHDIHVEKMQYDEVKQIADSCLEQVYIKINEINTQLYNELANIRSEFEEKINKLREEFTQK